MRHQIPCATYCHYPLTTLYLPDTIAVSASGYHGLASGSSYAESHECHYTGDKVGECIHSYSAGTQLDMRTTTGSLYAVIVTVSETSGGASPTSSGGSNGGGNGKNGAMGTTNGKMLVPLAGVLGGLAMGAWAIF